MLRFDSEQFMQEDQEGELFAEASSLGFEVGQWPEKFELSFKEGSIIEFHLINLACSEEGDPLYALYQEAMEEDQPLKIKILND